MTMTKSVIKRRKPQAFKAADAARPAGKAESGRPKGAPAPKARHSLSGTPPPLAMEDPIPNGDLVIVSARGGRMIGWGKIFLASLGSLTALGLGLAGSDLIAALFARNIWLGWAGAALLALAVVAAIAVTVREVLSLAALKTLARIKEDAGAAYGEGDHAAAARAIAALKHLAGQRADMAWGLSRFAEHEAAMSDPTDLLQLAERELIMPLDARARAIVADTVKRVSLITAVAPGAVLDIVVVGAANLRMVRRLAECYGGRPGALGLMKLARMVIAHLAMTGGIAVGENVLQQLLGHGLAAKLSTRLGEGMLNGVLSARIGLAAMEQIRPLPYHEAGKPRLSDVLATLVSVRKPADKPA